MSAIFSLVSMCFILMVRTIRNKASKMMILDCYVLGPWCKLWTFCNLDAAPIILKYTAMELWRRIVNAKNIVYLLHEIHKGDNLSHSLR